MPRPIPSGPRIFAVKSAGEVDRAAAASEILPVKFFDAGEMCLQRPHESIGKNGNAFAQAFAFAHGDLAITEIDVLDAKAEAFKKAEPAPVQQVGHDPIVSFEARENGASFGASKDDR